MADRDRDGSIMTNRYGNCALSTKNKHFEQSENP